VGRFTGGSQYLDGALDEVAIYKRSLTTGEVGWLYNNGNGRTYADLSSGPATYTYGDTAHDHAVTALSTGETYSYDANGNMTQRVEGGLTYTQTFDAENRLISVAVGGQTTQFIYNGDGNLVKKINPNGSKTLYVGGIYEVDKASGGSVTRTVTYYPVAGAMRIDNTLYYVLKDHLDSASVVTNNSGTIVGEQRYYPFGETRLTTGTIYTDKLFTGQREMAGLGRFLSPDTIIPGASNPQAYNRYSYVLNNPLRYIDPTGHDPVCGFDYSDPECESSENSPVVINNPGPLDPGLLQGGGGGSSGGNGFPGGDPGEPTQNPCSGSNSSPICADQTLVGDFFAYTNLDYLITLYPFDPNNSRLADYTKWRRGNAFLLLHDLLGIGLGNDWLGRFRDEYVLGVIPYKLHKNNIGYYATVQDVIVYNNTNSNIVVLNVESSDTYEFQFNAKPLIGQDQSRSIPLSTHMSTSITVNIWPNLQITAQIPWRLPSHLNP
jgi:RHS repeat-associated protein